MSLIAKAWSFINSVTQPELPRTKRKAKRGRALYMEALEVRQLMAGTPTVKPFTVAVTHDHPTSFTAAEFTSNFSGGTLVSVIIESVPVHGQLSIAGTSLNAGAVINLSALNTIIYTPATGYTGTDTFQWSASNSSGIAPEFKPITLSVVENKPTITKPITLSTGHNAAIAFTAAEFTSVYADKDLGDTLKSITITSLPQHGTLKLNGTALNLNAVVLLANLGTLTYTPDPTYSGKDSFLWSASDGLLRSVTSSLAINVVETAPIVTPFNVVPGQNEAISFLNGSNNFFTLQFSDADSGDSLTGVKIVTRPTHGVLALVDSNNVVTPVTAGQVIPLAQIVNLVYTPNTGYIGKDTFQWQASDGLKFSNTTTATFDVRYFTITANNNVLANGDKNPTATAFTDYGYASIAEPVSSTAIIPITATSVTRTYTINDVGSADLSLTGLTGLVKISGANASDFVVTTQPSSSTLHTGDSITFTITFTPSGVGTRNATVTIANSAPGSPFTFAIKGTGIATQGTADGLVISQIKKGTGVGAVSFDEMAVNYTGTLLNGTVFDSSLNPGRTPFQFALGQGQVISGWDEGLQNIKVGETRVLIIPAALGYGSTGQGTIPGNATLIFTVTCLGLAAPKLVLTGNNILMTPGDTSPSVLDGTAFGTLPAGSITAVHSFVITDGGGGILGFPSSTPAVTFTGTNAADFAASTISFASDGSSAGFTITFNPQGAGTRTAIAHVHTNDPDHPDFAFSISGGIAYTDLAISIAPSIALPPPSATIGGNTTLVVPVVIKNTGSLPVPSSTPYATITVLVHDSVNNVDLPLQIFTNQNVSGLGLNQSKTFMEKITLPNNFVADHDTITASIVADGTRPIIETNPLAANTTANNTVTTTIDSDLTGALVSTTIVPQVLSTTPQSGAVTVLLKNTGNFAFSSTQKVNLTFTAVPSVGSPITLATMTNQSLASLAGGATKTFTASFKNITFPEGTYTIEVVATLVPAIAGELSNNNNITLTSANTQLTITSTPTAFNNITGNLVSSTIPASGGNTGPVNGNVTVQLLNAGNSALPSGQLVQVQIIAHDLTTASTDITMATSGNLSLSSWASNKSQQFTIPVAYLGFLTADHQYQIEALIVPVDQVGKPVLVESSTADNLLVAKADNTTITHSAPASVNDFGVTMIASNLTNTAPNTAIGGTKGAVAVQIKNAGNIPFSSIQTVTIQIFAHLTSTTDITLGNTLLAISDQQSVANLLPGGILNVSVPVNYLAGLPAGSYTIEALVVPTQTLSPQQSSITDNYGLVTASNTKLTLTIA